MPLRLRKPSRIFVADMGDLFYEGVSNEDIAVIFGVMYLCSRHTFQVLTKRARRMREWFAWLTEQAYGQDPEAHKNDDTFGRQEGHFLGHVIGDKLGTAALVQNDEHEPNKFGVPWEWPLPNVWLGVSVEDQKYADERIPDLLRTRAAKRFVSYEPALGPVDFNDIGERIGSVVVKRSALTANALQCIDYAQANVIDQIIIGGESGPGARPMDEEWARSARDQCQAAGTAFFFKQWGGVKKKQAGRVLDGRTWDEFPPTIARQ